MTTFGQVFAYQEHTPRIDPSAYVAPGAMVLGRVVLGPRVSVWFNCVLRGDLGAIEIGEGSNIQDLTTVHIEGAEERADGAERGTVIGRNVTVGHNCVIHSCVLEDGCLIGMGAVVMGGARIGQGAIVGAGAVVLEETQIPPYSLAVGNPARVKKTYRPDEARGLIEGAARIYQARIGRFKAGLRPVAWP
jgi:carbonic anhydrase/acetyltransferase-like protein (isoleucine patch superfamily)